MLKLELTDAEGAALVQVMNSVQGLDNARVLLPIYDKLRDAAQAASLTAPEVIDAAAKAGKKRNGAHRGA